MNETLGVVVATVGLVITAAGVVGANIIVVRLLPVALRRPITTETRIAILKSVLRLLLFAAITMIGLTALLSGLVVAGDLVTWAPLAPLAVLALMVPTAWYARWLVGRLGQNHQ